MQNSSLNIFQFWIVNLWILILIDFLIIFPIIFHLLIIPKIEKRIGEKLKYKMPIYNWQIFAKWFTPPVDIGMAIFIKYLIWKILNRSPGKIWGFNPNNPHALMQVDYDIRQASYTEIVISFLVIIHIFIFICLVAINLLYPKQM